MTPAEKGQLAVKILGLWAVIAWLFVIYAWPPLLRLIQKRRREQMIARQRKALDEVMDMERRDFDAKLKAEASRIIRKLDEEAAQDFALEVDAAQAYLEYRAATDGRRSA